MDQEKRLAGTAEARRRGFKVVNAVAIDLDILAANALAPEVEADNAVVDLQRMEVKGQGAGGGKREEQDRCSPGNDFH